MNDMNMTRPAGALALPESAPLIRLTAGMGSAAQKTWNLRRPVTLVGSRRPAHIVLHDQATAKAHCVIVNTGTHVLLMDLSSGTGTGHNGRWVDGIVLLSDGDVVTIGTSALHIGVEYSAGTAPQTMRQKRAALHFPQPVAVCVNDADTVWRLEEAITLVGRHPDAPVRLDHENVSARHAIIFRYLDQPAIFDTGSRHGIWVSGEKANVALLSQSDRIMIGPYSLTVASFEELARSRKRAANEVGHTRSIHPAQPDAALHSPFAIWKSGKNDPESGTAKYGTEKSGIEAQQNPEEDTRAPHPARSTDALNRPGKEQTTADSHQQAGKPGSSPPELGVQMGTAELRQLQTGLTRREAELERREAELAQRERRLARLSSARRTITCPDCGKVMTSIDLYAPSSPAISPAEAVA